MLERLTVRSVVIASLMLLAPLFVVGWLTREDPADRPYLKVVGGGFIFNYRVADVYYGFTAVVQRPLPTGSIIEASFEDPAGGAAHLVRQRVGGAEATSYALRSPSVRGVEAGRPYHVAIRVLDREERHVLWAQGLDYVSQIDDSIVPNQPLTVGPGYARNPAVGR